ncbi:MAG TPA: ABC transporter permease [Gemmatimonadales bacterium]
MGRFLLGRFLLVIPTLVGVLVVAFLLLHVAPGDPVQAIVGDRADSLTVAQLRAELRLDEPLPRRFVSYVGGILTGDLGTSYVTRRPIAQDLAGRFPATLTLAFAAMLFATVAGVAIGVLGAWRPGTWWDRFLTVGAYLGVSFPVYWIGLLLILIFAVQLRWLPPSGSRGLAYLVLPALTLGMRSVAVLARMTRAALQEVLMSDYIRTARAKGLRETPVVLRHGLRNALIPVITVLGLDFGSYLTGSILTETIFAWPGVGRLSVQAIYNRDYPVVQAAVFLLSSTFVLVNLFVDLLYTYLDPRIRLR